MQVPDTVDTPAVLIDVDRLDRNVRTWADRMRTRGVGLRPHTKTSKCLPVIARQVAAGAVGLTVATVGEAELLADAGHTRLFQAYPLWAGTPARSRRLRALHERVDDLLIGVESTEGAAALGRAVTGSSRPLGVVIEVDSGHHRTGVAPHDVGRIARSAIDAGLDVRGAFTFGGHAYAACDAPAAAADDEVTALAHAAETLRRLGIEPAVLSAGSTPTADRSARPPVTDERAGTYVFQDRQQIALGSATLDEVALVVAATVVASHPDGRFVLDAGSKVLSSDRPAWLDGHGTVVEYPEAEIRALGEHAAMCVSSGPRPAVGDVVTVIPNHCCVVVNLVDELIAVQDGREVDRWAVASRGFNR